MEGQKPRLERTPLKFRDKVMDGWMDGTDNCRPQQNRIKEHSSQPTSPESLHLP